MTAQEFCLDCGAPEPGAFCSACGQRHVPLDKLDLRHVWLEYVEKGIRDMKPAHTVRTLFTEPGRLTLDYVAGRRKSQANPVALFGFLVTLNLTVVRLQGLTPPVFSAPLQWASLPAEDVATIEAAIAWFLGWATVALVYVQPLVSVPLEAAVLWLVGERDALKAGVFTLHVTIFSYIVGLSAQLLAVLVPMDWRLLVASGLGWATTLVALGYTLLAFRVAYPKLRWSTIGLVLAAQWIAPVLLLIAVGVVVLTLLGLLGFSAGYLLSN
jgi:hypothetical protein